jgi:hypothetical protein
VHIQDSLPAAPAAFVEAWLPPHAVCQVEVQELNTQVAALAVCADVVWRSTTAHALNVLEIHVHRSPKRYRVFGLRLRVGVASSAFAYVALPARRHSAARGDAANAIVRPRDGLAPGVPIRV